MDTNKTGLRIFTQKARNRSLCARSFTLSALALAVLGTIQTKGQVPLGVDWSLTLPNHPGIQEVVPLSNGNYGVVSTLSTQYPDVWTNELWVASIDQDGSLLDQEFREIVGNRHHLYDAAPAADSGMVLSFLDMGIPNTGLLMRLDENLEQDWLVPASRNEAIVQHETGFAAVSSQPNLVLSLRLIDSEGNEGPAIAYQQSFTAEGPTMDTASDGSIYMAGRNGDTRVVVVKAASDGEQVWVRHITAPGNAPFTSGRLPFLDAVAADGIVLTTASFDQSGNGPTVWVARIDAAGETVWAEDVAPGRPVGVTALQGGGYVVATSDKQYILNSDGTIRFTLDLPSSGKVLQTSDGGFLIPHANTLKKLHPEVIPAGDPFLWFTPSYVRPRPATGTFLLSSETPGTYEIRASDDLSEWTEIDEVNISGSEVAEVVDPDFGSTSTRFYQAVLLPSTAEASP